MAVVLDASALLALWLDEPGADLVSEALAAEGALVTTVNLAEALSKMSDFGVDPETLVPVVPSRRADEAPTTPIGAAISAGELVFEPFTSGDAVVSSALRGLTKAYGLSLGDRACLATARRLRLPVLTADRVWAAVADEVGVDVRLIR